MWQFSELKWKSETVWLYSRRLYVQSKLKRYISFKYGRFITQVGVTPHKYEVLQGGQMQRSVVQRSAVQCSSVQCSAVQCSAVQCSAVQCCAVQCSAVQCLRYGRAPGWVCYGKTISCWLCTKGTTQYPHSQNSTIFILSFQNVNKRTLLDKTDIFVKKLDGLLKHMACGLDNFYPACLYFTFLSWQKLKWKHRQARQRWFIIIIIIEDLAFRNTIPNFTFFLPERTF